jgi:hypothetical protein
VGRVSPVVPEARRTGPRRGANGKSGWIGKFRVLEGVIGKGRAVRQALSPPDFEAPQAWLGTSAV